MAFTPSLLFIGGRNTFLFLQCRSISNSALGGSQSGHLGLASWCEDSRLTTTNPGFTLSSFQQEGMWIWVCHLECYVDDPRNISLNMALSYHNTYTHTQPINHTVRKGLEAQFQPICAWISSKTIQKKMVLELFSECLHATSSPQKPQKLFCLLWSWRGFVGRKILESTLILVLAKVGFHS